MYTFSNVSTTLFRVRSRMFGLKLNFSIRILLSQKWSSQSGDLTTTKKYLPFDTVEP
jgi:hypothetical protein